MSSTKLLHVGHATESDKRAAKASRLFADGGDLTHGGAYCEKNVGIIHLTGRQKNRLPFSHPVLDCREHELTVDEIGPLVERHLKGDAAATEALILGNLVLVKWLVGRYLFHWPESRRFEDEICSEGLVAVTEGIREIDGPVGAGAIRAVLVVKIKSAIETFLNDFRSPIHASLSTNWRRVRQGRDPEYQYTEAVGVTPESGGSVRNDVGVYDDTPAYVDVLDSLERLREVDSEEMVDMVLLAIEQQHRLLESDLTDEERKLIAALASIAG